MQRAASCILPSLPSEFGKLPNFVVATISIVDNNFNARLRDARPHPTLAAWTIEQIAARIGAGKLLHASINFCRSGSSCATGICHPAASTLDSALHTFETTVFPDVFCTYSNPSSPIVSVCRVSQICPPCYGQIVRLQHCVLPVTRCPQHAARNTLPATRCPQHAALILGLRKQTNFLERTLAAIRLRLAL